MAVATTSARLTALLDRIDVRYALALGLVMRLAALVLLPDPDFPDARAYVADGRALFETGRMASIEYMPLYPIWTYLTGGGVTLRLADIALSVATIWLVWRLALEIVGDRRAAMIAAFAASLWPHFVFYAVTGLTETAYAFVVCLAFFMLYRQRWFWGMALFALSILIRPTLELLLPILVVAFALIVHRTGWRAAGKRVAQLAVIYLVVMAPWWAHQYAKYGQFIRLNLGDGIVLYSGNNPMNRSGGGITGVDYDPAPFVHLANDPVARNAAMKTAAFKFIRDNPGRFAELAAIKFVRFWQPWPFTPEYRTPSIVAVSLLSYGVMLLAALWFLITRGLRHWRRLAPVVLFAGYLTAVHMVTIASVRYRFPIEPFVIMLGGAALARLFGGSADGALRSRGSVQ